MTMVSKLGDDEDGWDGLRYVKELAYGIEFMAGAQLINELTAWDGQLALKLMSLQMLKAGAGGERGADADEGDCGSVLEAKFLV